MSFAVYMNIFEDIFLDVQKRKCRNPNVFSFTKIVLNAPLPPSNEYNTGIGFDGTSLTVTDAGGNQTIDISSVSTDDQTISSTVTTPNEVVNVALEDGGNTNINIQDADADPTNEIQDLELIGNTLSITNNGQAGSIDLTQYLELPATALVGEVLQWDGSAWVASELADNNWVANGDDISHANGVVGIGTARGGPVPNRDSKGIFRGNKKFNGKLVISKLDEKFNI